MKVALTFDDGPVEDSERLISFLVDHDAAATFFLRGDRCLERPDLVRLMDASPRLEVATHSHTHPNLHDLAPAEIRRELEQSNDAVRAATDKVPPHFRPPMGHRNETVDTVARDLGQSVVLWSLNSMDFKDGSAIAHRVLTSVEDGDIVLLHDTHPETVDATIQLVPALRERGFELVTVSELLGSTRPGKVYRGRNSRPVRFRRWVTLQRLRVAIRARRLLRR